MADFKQQKVPYNCYLIDHDLFIGVSAILNMESMGDFLITWALRTFSKEPDPLAAHQMYMQRVSEAGTAIHKYIELDLAKEANEHLVTEEIIDAVEAYHEWKAHHEIEVLASERTVHHDKWRCAGTLDAVLKVDGKLSIVDFKTGKFKPRYFTQLSAYWAMLCAEPKKKRIADIEKADFTVIEVPRDGGEVSMISLSDKYNGMITREDELGLFHALRYIWYMRNLKTKQFQPVIKNMDLLLNPMDEDFRKTFNINN